MRHMTERGIRAGVRRLFRLPASDIASIHSDADEELASFLQARIEDLVARGMRLEDARAQAVSQLGGTSFDSARDRLRRSAVQRERRMRFHEHLEGLWHDLRLAARHLVNAPGFTVVIVTTLALG